MNGNKGNKLKFECLELSRCQSKEISTAGWSISFFRYYWPPLKEDIKIEKDTKKNLNGEICAIFL